MSYAGEFNKTEPTSGDDWEGGWGDTLIPSGRFPDTQGLRVITYDAWVTETVCWINVSACVLFLTK